MSMNKELKLNLATLANKQNAADTPITEVVVCEAAGPKAVWYAAVPDGVWQTDGVIPAAVRSAVNSYNQDAFTRIVESAQSRPDHLALVGSRTGRVALLEHILAVGQKVAGPEKAAEFFAVAETRRTQSQANREAYFARLDARRLDAVKHLLDAGFLTKEEALARADAILTGKRAQQSAEAVAEAIAAE